jgi:hypothetical protein
MTLDSRFIIASDLQSLYRDKDTGLPLRNGVIYFWQDQARTIPKDVFKLSGSPPNYSYISIGAEVVLTAAGTFSDNENPANDIVPYYFPYEGTADTSSGIIELYYVEVYSEGGKTTGVLQFTREAWPNLVTSESATQNLQNYAPNGQFKIHTNTPADNDVNPRLVAGEIRQAITNLAQGGWTFERPDASAAKDIVLFEPFGSYVTNPTASPTFFINISNESPSAGDAYKDLRLKFNDVNKFASDTIEYTFAFTGESNGGSVNVALILIKNYGTGGDTTDEIPIANFIVTNSFTIIQKSGFTFGDNTGKTISPDGDDYIQLALRFPTGSLFDVSLTDFILTPNNVVITNFPQTTDREFTSQAITPDIPAYDSSDLYLPVRLSPQRLIYDSSEVGEVIAESNISTYVNSLHPSSNKLLADGSQYETAGFSPLGIPFARLQSVYWDEALQLPIHGTGPEYFLSLVDGSITDQIVIANNSAAVVTAASDGTPATGFSFLTVHTGGASEFDCIAWYVNGVGFFIENKENGTPTTATAGTSGYTVTVHQTGNSYLPELTLITPGASTGGGTYFTFSVYAGGSFNYFVWFQVNGVGVEPVVPGHTGILINLTAGDNPDTVAQKIPLSLNTNGQVSAITTVAGSLVPAGSYFNVIASGGAYYVWYTVDGLGTDPQPASAKPIAVAILSTDTASQVASKTQAAINRKYFAAPNYQGYFLRGLGDMANVPADDVYDRYSFIPGVAINASSPGTFQLDEFKAHSHNYEYVSTGTGELAAGTDSSIVETTVATTSNGKYEVRPYNKNVNYSIRY